MAELDMTRIPRHIAIIMDGNGRWATERGKDRSFGHQEGVEFMPQLSQTAKNDGETLAITGAPLSMSARTVPLSSTISFASCGHTTKHWPQRMHWSLMICA